MLRDRTLRTALLTMVAILLGGLVRPAPNPQLGAECRFWAQKMLWSADYDLVLAGDSRTYIGVRPAVMAPSLPGYRIANFGFDACGFSPAYLRSLERLLDRGRGPKVVIVGVTPHSLTSSAGRGGSPFSRWASTPRLETLLTLHVTQAIPTFAPYDLARVKDRVLGREPQGNLTRKYASDGWCGTVRARATPQAVRFAVERTLDASQEVFQGNPVSDKVIADFLTTVRRWRAEGIAVYGFRPPTPVEMTQLENRAGHFSDSAFSAQFERAGGRWLRFEAGRYESYDGSHLTVEAANDFSGDLAEAVAADLGRRGAGVRK